MSDDMLHAILQMPPDLWSDRDIWQRHGRYCEASKRIIELESERNEAREALKRLKKELISANRGAETNAKVNQSLAKKLHDLEGYAAKTLAHLQACSTMRGEVLKERDDALKEWDLARDGWRKALEERDEARRERDEALQRLSVWHGAVSQMKKQLSFAPPLHQGIDAQEEA